MSTRPYGFQTPEELNIHNHICILPFGEYGSETLEYEWSMEELRPYQFYLVNNEPVDRMFTSFIFNAYEGRKGYSIHPMYAGFEQLAQKEDWDFILDRYFTKGYNFDALSLNTPFAQYTDVWITIPYPLTFQENFGMINGRSYNFKSPADRLDAVKWWIDTFLARWNSSFHLHDKLRLKGFVWQRGTIPKEDEELVKASVQYVRSKQLLSMWLPYLNGYGCYDITSFEFDVASASANYYGNTEISSEYIMHVTNYAKYHRTGVQMIAGKGPTFNSTHITDYIDGASTYEYDKALIVCDFANQNLRDLYYSNPSLYQSLYSFLKR